MSEFEKIFPKPTNPMNKHKQRIDGLEMLFWRARFEGYLVALKWARDQRQSVWFEGSETHGQAVDDYIIDEEIAAAEKEKK